jgi:hypothetical protein
LVKRRPRKAIGARSARKLLREVGGAVDVALSAELERALGPSQIFGSEVFRLSDGRVLHVVAGSANMFESAEEFRLMLAKVEEVKNRTQTHPLGVRFAGGEDFIAVVPQLVSELPGKIGLSVAVLDGSVASLEHVDRAARRQGGGTWLDDATVLAPLVAYVGEVMRNATGGDWAIRRRPGQDWEAIVVDQQRRQYSTCAIFKELLEEGSVYAAIQYQVEPPEAPASRPRAGIFAGREPRIAGATGPLGKAPAGTYEVTKRHGDGRPWCVVFNHDVEVGGFPFKAGSEAWFTRRGEAAGGTFSRPHTIEDVRFDRGTFVSYDKGPTGRIWLGSARLAVDQDVRGLRCQGGTDVQFGSKRQVDGATLAEDQVIGGVPCLAGQFVSFHKDGRVQSGFLSEDYAVSGHVIPKGSWIGLDKRGRLEAATLAGDHAIGGVVHRAGTLVWFDADGHVTRAERY